MKKLTILVVGLFLLISILGCSSQDSGLGKTVEAEYFTYEVRDDWQYEQRFEQDFYFLTEAVSSVTEAPTIFVNPFSKLDAPHETLEAQRSYLRDLFGNTADNAEVLFSEETELDGYAVYTDEVRVTGSEQGDYIAHTKMFFVAPDVIASMCYVASVEEYDTYKEVADSVFNSVKLKHP